jgi:hypothetical protein
MSCQGGPDLAIYRKLGDCLFWVSFLKLHKEPEFTWCLFYGKSYGYILEKWVVQSIENTLCHKTLIIEKFREP